MKHRLTKHWLITSLILATASTTALAMGGDDPVLSKVVINQLETRESDEQTSRGLDAQVWIGKDLNKLWLKTEVEHSGGEYEHLELQTLYSRAISPYWDVQFGLRKDIKPNPDRDWVAVGLQGLAPYFFETELTLFAGNEGRTSARLDAEYEILFTQRLILTPEIEINVYGKDDKEVGIGSGLSDANAALRLRYEVVREFAPYVGMEWWKKFGTTADLTSAVDAETDGLQLVLGIRAWF